MNEYPAGSHGSARIAWRLRRRLLPLGVPIALLLLAPAAAAPWKSLNLPGVQLRHQAGHDAAAGRAAGAASGAVERVSAELAIRPRRSVTLILHPTHREFTRAIGIRRREMVVGIAAGAHDVAHIDASGKIADLSRVVAHEVAHLLLAQAMGEDVPAWFDEGYAEHTSGSVEWMSRERLAEETGTSRLFRLAELERSFPRGGQDAAIAYAQSHALVAYILKHAPPGALPGLARRTRAGEGFEAALAAATGRDSAAWDAVWRHDFGGGVRWHRWIAFAAGASGIVMVFLCLLAYRAVKQRKARLPG